MSIVNNRVSIIHTILYLVLFVFFSLSATQAQSFGDIEITEIQYGSENSWIEIVNSSGGNVDITKLKIAVGEGAQQAVAKHGATDALLASGKTAIIAADPTTFEDTYADYTGALYTSNPLILPENNGMPVNLFAADGTTVLHGLTYNTNTLASSDGITLHVGLDATIVAAPATPGTLAVNPIAAGLSAVVPSVAVASSVSDGVESGGLVFLGDGDVITLNVFHTEQLPSDLGAKIMINSVERTAVASAGGNAVSKTFTYTIAANDPSGHIKYALTGTGITSVDIVTDKGKPSVIGADTPTISFETTLSEGNTSRMSVDMTITDTAAADEMGYKLHTATTCTTKQEYDAISATEKIIAVTPKQRGEDGDSAAEEDNKFTSKIVLFGSENNGKYVCVRVEDLLGRDVYTSSPQISGITDLNFEITELSYNSSEGGEWIEIINSGDTAMDVTSFVVLDSGTRKSITNTDESGSDSLNTGEIAVIVSSTDLDKFRSEYGGYNNKPLFTASISLTDGGDTVGLQKDGENIDSVTYKSTNGARRNSGKTLHILSDGRILEGLPSPGIASVAADRVTAPETGDLPDEAVQVNEDRPVVTVHSFDGKENLSAAGQNIFFIKDKNSVSVEVRIKDNDTNYSNSNLDEHLRVSVTATDSNTIRYGQESVNYSSGVAIITYRIHFSKASGTTVQDNRVTLSFKVTDADEIESSKQSVVTVVRNSTKPLLENATSATVLGFAANTANIIVPVTASGIVPGDWLRVIYNDDDVCGDGSLSFMARNGGHGIPYTLEAGTHSGCTVSASDSAGNIAVPITIPQIIVGG